MSGADERHCNPVAREELERRWSVTREGMKTAGIDALVVQGAGNTVGIGGNLRWLSGISAAPSYAQTIVFPLDGLMTLVMHGAAGVATQLDDGDPTLPGVGRKLTTSSFPQIAYTATYDADVVADVVQESGYSCVGLVAPGTTYFGFGSRLRERLGSLQLVDASEMIDEYRAIKSAAEIEAIRKTAALQDAVLERVLTHIRPGMRDFEVMAYSQYMGQLMGSETGYYLGSSAGPEESAHIRLRAHQGRQLARGDVLFWQSETTGPGGYFVHLGRFLSLGKPSAKLLDAFSRAVEAQDYTLEMLRPGASCSDIFSRYNGYLRRNGLPEESRLHCHGQGYEAVERPLIRTDEDMTIAESMNIGLHPSFSIGSTYVTVCDNFLIGRNCVERLHGTPREILRVD